MDSLVSVIFVTYNESKEIITKAISSIVNQTYTNLEILILDDSTSPDTKSAIDSFASDERVKVFREDERLGMTKSRNKGLDLAKGEYIAVMDGDDISDLNRIATEVQYLKEHEEVGLVGSQINIINAEDKVVSKRNYPLGGFKLWLFSCFRNPVAHPTVMFKKSLVNQGYRYNENLKMSEDLDLWLRMMNGGVKVRNINEVLLNYRVQENFTTKRLSNEQRKYMLKVRKMNFSWKHFVHSIISVLAGIIFNIVPAQSIKSIYAKENGER